jgi:hypothetical protein
MRIISKFKDYYDSAAGMGIDKELVYLRKTEVIKKVEIGFEPVGWYVVSITMKQMHQSLGTAYHAINKCILGFCGRSFPVFNIGDRYFCSYEQVVRQMKKDLDPKSFKEAIEDFETPKRYSMDRGSKRGRLLLWAKEIREFNPLEWHFKYKVPIFLYEDKTNKVILNPPLKPMGFAAIKSSYEAFQEIGMFLSGVLGSHDDPDQIKDDKVLRDAKGFNDMSFKNIAPGQRKENRRKNKERKRNA